MSRKNIINTIRSYAIILLLHLIKQQVENRTTHSWDVSIVNSVRGIIEKNKRRKAGGYYVPLLELRLLLESVYPNAIGEAALEVASGEYDPDTLEDMVNQEDIIDRALTLISPEDGN